MASLLILAEYRMIKIIIIITPFIMYEGGKMRLRTLPPPHLPPPRPILHPALSLLPQHFTILLTRYDLQTQLLLNLRLLLQRLLLRRQLPDGDVNDEDVDADVDDGNCDDVDLDVGDDGDDHDDDDDYG